MEVVEDDRPLALGTPQQRLLLAVLLVHRGEAVSSDRLVDELWGEHAPASATKIVQGYVSNLRKVLGDGLLVTRGRGYVLQPEPGQLDVDRFESLLADARTATQSPAVLRDIEAELTSLGQSLTASVAQPRADVDGGARAGARRDARGRLPPR